MWYALPADQLLSPAIGASSHMMTVRRSDDHVRIGPTG
jgi:hypothetical protein